jgi:hypothetical protein
MLLTGETEVLYEESAQVPLREPQIPYELAWNRTPFSLIETPHRL